MIDHDSENQEVRKWHCAECGAELTHEEVAKWWEETPRCCDGYMCGCYGLPIDPPYCDKCMKRDEIYPFTTVLDHRGRKWTLVRYDDKDEGVKVEMVEDGIHWVGWVTYNDLRLLSEGKINVVSVLDQMTEVKDAHNG